MTEIEDEEDDEGDDGRREGQGQHNFVSLIWFCWNLQA